MSVHWLQVMCSCRLQFQKHSMEDGILSLCCLEVVLAQNSWTTWRRCSGTGWNMWTIHKDIMWPTGQWICIYYDSNIINTYDNLEFAFEKVLAKQHGFETQNAAVIQGMVTLGWPRCRFVLEPTILIEHFLVLLANAGIVPYHGPLWFLPHSFIMILPHLSWCFITPSLDTES